MSDNSLMLLCTTCMTRNRVPGSRLREHPSCGKCKNRLLSSVPLDLTGDQFDALLQKDELPVLVDFWAAWCGPCRQMAPAFKNAAITAGESVRFVKLDTETNQSQSARHQIRSLPTLALFVKGKEVDRRMGLMNEQQILNWLRSHVPDTRIAS